MPPLIESYAPARAHMTTPSARTLLAAAFAALLALLTGCGGDPIINEPIPAVGSYAKQGPIELHNVYLARPEGAEYEPGEDTIGFLTVTSNGEHRDRLVSVSSPVADQIQLRWDRDCDGTAQRVDALPLLAEGTVPEAKRGGAVGHAPYFLHVVGMTEELTAGTTVPVRFEFGRAGEITMPVMVHGGSPSEARRQYACNVAPASLLTGR